MKLPDIRVSNLTPLFRLVCNIDSELTQVFEVFHELLCQGQYPLVYVSES